ncbi:unnamed protein product, partial [Didymodactylos carnosus]
MADLIDYFLNEFLPKQTPDSDVNLSELVDKIKHSSPIKITCTKPDESF